MLNRLIPSPALRAHLRRALFVVAGLAIVTVVALAGLIVSRDYAAIERAVLARFERETGAKISFASRRQILWLKPKITFQDVIVTRPGQDFALRAPQVILNFDLSDLIDGEISAPAVTFVAAQIDIAAGRLDAPLQSPRAIAGFLDQLAGLLDDRPGIDRLRLAFNSARITFRNPAVAGETLVLAPVEARLWFSAAKGRIDLSARRDSEILPLELSASVPTRKALAGGRSGPVALRVSGYESRLVFSGTSQRDPDMSLTGKLDLMIGNALEKPFRAEIRGAQTALDATQINANATLDPRGIGLESLRIQRGGKQLAGIAALREVNGRWGISATVAGDLVDGTAAHAALQNLRNADGSWSTRPLSINPFPAIDLDIRLSTREFRLGKVLLANAALSILTRQGRSEVAIVDSRFGDGVIKARVSLVDTPESLQEIRVSATADRIDVGRLLDRALAFSRLQGEGYTVVQAESRGANIAALMSNLAGSGALDMRGGEIIGIDLQRLLARTTEGRPDTALILSLGGKTAFESLRANFALKDGRIEPVGSSFTSARVNAMIEGAMDIGGQSHQLAIVLKRRIDEPGQPSEFYAFRMDGPLFAPNLKPDLKLLLNRS